MSLVNAHLEYLAHSSDPGQKDTDMDLLTGSESIHNLIPSYRPKIALT